MFKSIEEYLGIEFPKGQINGSWFAEHKLPMVVSCTCCARLWRCLLPELMRTDIFIAGVAPGKIKWDESPLI